MLSYITKVLIVARWCMGLLCKEVRCDHVRHQLLVITLQLLLTASHDVAWAVLHNLLINDGNTVYGK